MSLGENTVQELYSVEARGRGCNCYGGEGESRVESQAARAGKTDVMTH